MARIVKGQVVALFAFDVGYEVSLERLSAMLATTPVQPLSRKKQTPTYMQYSKPPQILSLGLATGHFAVAGSIQATIFDFGAVSVAYRWPIGQGNELSLEDLPQVSHDLYNLDLGLHAKEQVESLMRKIESAIFRARLSDLVEDYYLFIIEELDRQMSASEVLSAYRGLLARTLRFETADLSRPQQDEALGSEERRVGKECRSRWSPYH